MLAAGAIAGTAQRMRAHIRVDADAADAAANAVDADAADEKDMAT